MSPVVRDREIDSASRVSETREARARLPAGGCGDSVAPEDVYTRMTIYFNSLEIIIL